MSNLKEYFDSKEHYKPKWDNGARVFGYWNKVPFIGSVVADREKDYILVQTDLPIKLIDSIHNIVIVKHKGIKPLKEY